MSGVPGSAARVAPTPRSPRFATRLLLAQALVLLAGAVTTWGIALLLAPGIFHTHLARAGVAHDAAETRHVEQAFGSALLISIALAAIIAFAAALAVSWYFSRQVQRSIRTVSDAAHEISAGRYDTRVPDPGLGAEFATLATGYNSLAGRLEATESTRRRMLADLAHEMRTPLATIDAHLEAVEDGVRTLDSDTVAVFRGSTRRLRRLAEDITAVSRAEEGGVHLGPRPVGAAGPAHAAADAARARYVARGVRLDVRAEQVGLVRVDPDRLAQVLGNLLDNALRHTPEDGSVALTCHRRGDWVEYAVSDTGEGIPPEHLPHVFDRFYRVDTARDRTSGGSGIGLSIARALTEAHGGTLTVRSDGPGRGTTFTVRLPAARA